MKESYGQGLANRPAANPTARVATLGVRHGQGVHAGQLSNSEIIPLACRPNPVQEKATRAAVLRASRRPPRRSRKTDRLRPVRDVTNNSGVVKDTLVYDGFGNITSETNSAFRGRYTWTGRERDEETKLQYNRARYYDASIGRWTSRDPLGFDAGDSNVYRYANNQPQLSVDPSGLYIPHIRFLQWQRRIEDGLQIAGALLSGPFGCAGCSSSTTKKTPTPKAPAAAGGITINIYVGNRNDNLVKAYSKKFGAKYYGTSVDVVYEVKGIDNLEKYTVIRTKKEQHVENIRGRQTVTVNDKKPEFDGPTFKPPLTFAKRDVGGTWTHTNYDGPTFAVLKSHLPASKKVTYEYRVEDRNRKVYARKSITMTWDIDKNGKVTVTPPPNANITLNLKGYTYEFIRK